MEAPPPVASVVGHACIGRLSPIAASVNQRWFFMDVIRTIEYPGSLDHFRAFMEQFLAFNRGKWTVGNTTYYLWVGRDHNKNDANNYRASWEFVEQVSQEPGGIQYWNVKAGIIYALEKYPNKTTVQFIDGVNNTGFFNLGKDSPKMGNDLLVIAEEITSQIQNLSPSLDVSQEPKTSNLRDWFDYYYTIKGKIRLSMDYIAQKTGYSVSTVYKEHTYYKNEHGIKKKAVRKSKKK